MGSRLFLGYIKKSLNQVCWQPEKIFGHFIAHNEQFKHNSVLKQIFCSILDENELQNLDFNNNI